MTETTQRVGPIIILEGVDKTGKSTLAMELAQTLVNNGYPTRVTAFGVPTPGKDPFVEYLDLVYSSMFHAHGTIVDRMHWSELAYASVFRPGNRDEQYIRKAKVRAIDTLLGMAGATVIHCVRPNQEAAAAIDDVDRADHGGADFGLEQVRRLGSVFSAHSNGVQRGLTGPQVIVHPFAAPITNAQLDSMIESRQRFADREGPLQ